jgi:hypothetical protein
MEKSIGQVHNELLEFMMKNHDITKFETFDKYIEYQYDYLVAEYPELAKYGKEKFVESILLTLNSNNISEFDYKRSVVISLEQVKDLKLISDRFYSEATELLNDESVDGENFEERIGSLEATNEVEKDFISNALDVATHSKEFWEANSVEKRNWVVWGADTWGSAVAGIGAGFLSVNPIVGFLAGVAGGELMSAAVGAVQGQH